MKRALPWVPVLVLAAGWLLLLRVHQQSEMDLRAPLGSVPTELAGYRSERELVIPEDQQQVAGMDEYVSRIYTRDSTDFFTLYVGYYRAQTQGRAIHSPKNCLPGGGWEPVSAGSVTVNGDAGPVTVNRYVLEKSGERALVYYWYQGRGRVAWNEYAVKWDLLRDKAVHGRSEEALVRIVVPIWAGNETRADKAAAEIAGELIAPVERALPAGPAAG